MASSETFNLDSFSAVCAFKDGTLFVTLVVGNFKEEFPLNQLSSLNTYPRSIVDRCLRVFLQTGSSTDLNACCVVCIQASEEGLILENSEFCEMKPDFVHKIPVECQPLSTLVVTLNNHLRYWVSSKQVHYLVKTS